MMPVLPKDVPGVLKPCRECKHPIALQAFTCPNCGAPYPAKDSWTGWGFEYKSKANIAGLPLVHIAFKYMPNRMPVVAKGFLAIGQFATGVICISQFGIGIFSLSQFTVAGYAIAQFGIAYNLLAQIGIYLNEGRGQLVISLGRILELLK